KGECRLLLGSQATDYSLLITSLVLLCTKLAQKDETHSISFCAFDLHSCTAVHNRGRLHLRCKCPQIHSGPAIPAEKILSLRVFPAGPHCKNDEIIATMKKGQTCLDPTKDWVISLKEEINKRNIKSQP
uniref:Chemokine interleukin-8-like domain-containing protein n=1 Tax=Cyprinus carpio TaxID=7962 RepID=A0A8C2GX34_CYPCA